MTSPPAEPTDQGFPGQRLGLPAAGAGSVASWGERLVALLIDWIVANLVAFAVAGPVVWSPRAGAVAGWLPLLVWLVQVWLLTGLGGGSLGQHLMRLQVIRLDRRPVGLGRGLVRTVLIALVLPPLVWDRDRRGLHDRAVGTIVVRGPRSRR